MKRLLFALGVVGFVLSGAAVADDAGLCRAECDSARTQCRANTGKASGDDAVLILKSEETNPLARAAQGAVTPTGTLALERSGQQNRRAQQRGICDDTYQRCTRACSAQDNSGSPLIRKRSSAG
ncbi:MAG: hypothetical protein AB1584_12490 [Pseudomonadota bacterium]